MLVAMTTVNNGGTSMSSTSIRLASTYQILISRVDVVHSTGVDYYIFTHQ